VPMDGVVIVLSSIFIDFNEVIVLFFLLEDSLSLPLAFKLGAKPISFILIFHMTLICNLL